MSDTPDPSFEELFRRYRRDAVLLHRPYPPNQAPPTNSKFGGLPNLPAHYDWPRSSKGRPFHFLAQIACADINFETPLPKRGVLFFFGDDGGEQEWDFQEHPEDDCRVLYVLDALPGTPPRAAPDDLGPIGGIFPPWAWREFLREGEYAPNVHVEWPIQPLPIDSWPDALFDDEEEKESPFLKDLQRFFKSPQPRKEKWQDVMARKHSYEERHQQARGEAFTKVTGERLTFDPNDIGVEWRAGQAIFGHAEAGPEAYPQHWITIHYAARAVLHQPTAVPGNTPGMPQLVSAAEEWLRRSNAMNLDEPVAEEDRRAFRAWLTSLRWSYEQSPLGNSAGRLVFLSLVATIRSWAGDARRAARLAPHVYEAMRFFFTGFTVWGLQYAQMLGHAPSAQSPQPPDEPSICLLNLASDYGLGWMFGDVGNCTFWIEPEDLARRDFETVTGVIEGH